MLTKTQQSSTDYIAKIRERWFTYSQSPEQIVAAALNTIPGIVWQHDAQTNDVDFLVVFRGRRIALKVQAECIPSEWVHKRLISRKVKICSKQLHCCFDELIFLEKSDIASPKLTHHLSCLLGQAAVVCH